MSGVRSLSLTPLFRMPGIHSLLRTRRFMVYSYLFFFNKCLYAKYDKTKVNFGIKYILYLIKGEVDQRIVIRPSRKRQRLNSLFILKDERVYI